MLNSRYATELVSGTAKQIMTCKANKVSFSMANSSTDVSGYNFFSVYPWYSTIATKFKELIAATDKLDETAHQWKAFGSEEDAKAFVTARDDLKRICADTERLFMVIVQFDDKNSTRFIVNIRKVSNNTFDIFAEHFSHAS